MNSDILKGKWLEIKGRMKERWGRLTKNDLGEIEGKNRRLLGTLQKKHGYIKGKAAPEYKDGVELAEIVSRIREIRSIINKDGMTMAFIARYGRHLSAEQKTGQATGKDEKNVYATGQYFNSRLPRRTLQRH